MKHPLLIWSLGLVAGALCAIAAGSQFTLRIQHDYTVRLDLTPILKKSATEAPRR